MPLLRQNAPDAAIAVVAAAAIATAVCVVVHSAAGAVGAADAFCAVVALMPLPSFVLTSSVFGTDPPLFGCIAMIHVMIQV